MSPLHINIGQRIRSRRLALKLSLKQCAQLSGLSPRYLIQAEGGTANLSLKKLADLCETLNLRLAELLSDGERGKIDTLLSHLAPPQLDEAYQLLRDRFGQPRPPLIALLGVRGAGKSTIGRALAQRLEWPLIELDHRIEARAELNLSEIFSLHGEKYYRRLEREALIELIDDESQGGIIATGGSIVTDTENYHLLRRSCLTLWLKASAEDHWSRVIHQGDRRPMRDHPHAMAELRSLLSERDPLYAMATIQVDSHDQSVESVTALALEQLHPLINVPPSRDLN